MGWGVRGTYISATGNATSRSLTVPSSVVAGDLLYAALYWDDTTPLTVTPPSDWTEIIPQEFLASAGAFHLTYCRIAQAGDADSVHTWTHGVSQWREGVMVAFYHTDGAVPSSGTIEDSDGQSSTTGSTAWTAPASTSLAAGALHVISGSSWSGGSGAPPSGFAEAVDNASEVQVGWKELGAAGLSTPGLYNAADDNWAAVGVIFKAPSGGAQTIIPSSIASLEAFGTARINQAIAPSGIASLGAFGTAMVKLTVQPSGIASVEAFGTAKVNQQVQPAGIASAEAFGTHIVTVAGAAQTITPGGIASLEVFGTLLVNQQIQPVAIASLEAFGTAKINQAITPAGIVSLEAFGTAKINQAIALAGIASAEAFGTLKLNQWIVPAGIASAEAFGTHIVSVGGGVQTIIPSGIASAEAFGTLLVNQQVRPVAIATAEAFGTLLVNQQIRPAGIASAEAFGTLMVRLTILPSGIASLEAFGLAIVTVVGGATPVTTAAWVVSDRATYLWVVSDRAAYVWTVSDRARDAWTPTDREP